MVGWHHWLNGRGSEQTSGQWRTEGPGLLQSMGSQRGRHDLATEQKQSAQIRKWAGKPAQKKWDNQNVLFTQPRPSQSLKQPDSIHQVPPQERARLTGHSAVLPLEK